MTTGQSNLLTLRLPDAPIELPAGYVFSREDRRFIDNQVQALQLHVSGSLINGQLCSWYTSDGSQPALLIGDCVTASTATSTVRLASTAAVAATGVVLGMVVETAPAGAPVRVCSIGQIAATISGLGATSGVARVSSLGRAERVGSYSTGDIPLGPINNLGSLTIAPSGATGSGGGGGGPIDADLLQLDYVPAGFVPVLGAGIQATATDQLSAMLAGISNQFKFTMAYMAEGYVPTNVSYASIDAANTWDIYVQLALNATKFCLLGPRAYNVSSAMTIPNGGAIMGRGAKTSGFVLKNAGLSGAVVKPTSTPSTDWKVAHLFIDGENRRTDQPLLSSSSLTYVEIDSVALLDAFAATATNNQTGVLSMGGDINHLTIKNCYVEQTVTLAGGSGKLLGMSVINTGSTGKGIRFEHNEINGINFTNGIYLDSYSGVLHDAWFTKNYVYNCDYTALQVGYLNSVADQFCAIFEGNITRNCGGPGIYATGNDNLISGGTAGTQSSGVLITNNIVAFCGGQIAFGVFSTGITVGVVQATINNNFVYHPGLTEIGTLRPGSAIMAAIGQIGAPNVDTTYICNNNTVICSPNAGVSVLGIAFDTVINGEFCGNQLIDCNQCFSVGSAYRGAVAGSMTFSGNSGTARAYGMALSGDATLKATWNVTGNNFRLTNGSAYGYRLDTIFRGLFTNNTISGTGVAGFAPLANGPAAALSYTLSITGNYISGVTYGQQIGTIAGTPWYLAQPNFCDTSTVPVNAAGAAPARVHEVLSDAGYRRNVMAAAAPAAGEIVGGGRVGDVVTLTTPTAITTPFTGHIIAYQCITNSADPGTWRAILTCTSPS